MNSMAPQSVIDLLHQNGCVAAVDALDQGHVDALREACEPLFAEAGAKAGIRNVISRVPAIASLASGPFVHGIVEPILGPRAFVARSLLFDKTADSNWNVGWHQDTTIAVVDRVDAPGFGPWSVKHEIDHVQPPGDVLERMVTVRVHLDDCGEQNGPLLVIPGSHSRGILSDHEVDRMCLETRPVAMTCRSGAIIVMRPLILHASRKSASPSRRRVIHLEFAADPLPFGLQWAHA